MDINFIGIITQVFTRILRSFREFIPGPPWVSTLVLALIAALIIGLVMYIVNRRKKGGKAKKSGPAQPPPIPRKSLVRIWKAFVRRMPWDIRRYLGDFQPFFVMGEAGSGKSSLISACTDWEGKALQFQPSHVDSPLMQCYMGARAVVLEMPSIILTDVSSGAHRALKNLLKQMPCKKEFQVVITLNGASLEDEDPENLKKLARYMRGKISLMEIGKRPVQVRLALTHMDQVHGFVQWMDFLQKHRLSPQVSWDEKIYSPDLARVQDGYERLLPRALTSMSSRDYLAMVGFLKDFRQRMQILQEFADVLLAPDPFSKAPQIAGLTMHGSGQENATGNPFETGKEAMVYRQAWPANRKHQVAAAGIFLAASLGLVSAFGMEYRDLTRLDYYVEAAERRPPADYAELHSLFPLAQYQGIYHRVLPRFFPESEEVIVKRLTDIIRKHYLYPELYSLRTQVDNAQPLVYLLGLIYASPNNPLGPMILTRSHTWAENLDLPRQLVEDYASSNQYLPDVIAEVDIISHIRPQTLDPSEDATNWTFFLRRVEKLLQAPYMSPKMLEEVQDLAEPLLDLMQEVYSYPMLYEVVEHLQQVAVVGPEIQWVQRRDRNIRQKELLELLKLVSRSSLETPDVQDRSLHSLFDLMDSLSERAPDERPVLNIFMDRRNFRISMQEWVDLEMRSKKTLMMRQFAQERQQSRGLIFFEETDDFPHIHLNPAGEGTLFFAGRARVDGLFSAKAFEKRVRPGVISLDEKLEETGVSQEEQDRFAEFVERQLESYAERYVESYVNYYHQFHIRAHSEGTLRFVLNEIPTRHSPFLRFLLTLHENTSLDTSGSPLFRSFANQLEKFGFVRNLMHEEDGVIPEWRNYTAFINQMREELDGRAPWMSQDDGAETFKERLSPLGRISFTALQDDPDAYVNLVRKWLSGLGVDPEWRGPFLEPFLLAFNLGRSDIENTMAKVWQDIRGEHISHLQRRFPLDPTAEARIDPAALEDVIHPEDGDFWEDFEEFLGPFFRESRDGWVQRDASRDRINLPRGMLTTVNELHRIAGNLWDREGEPRPLVFNVLPTRLPAARDRANVPVVAYLRSGESSVFAFNQQPDWQEVRVKWWKSDAAVAGMGFQSPSTNRRVHRELRLDEQHWGLFSLLKKARPLHEDTFAWSLESPWGGSITVEFTFEADPWEAVSLQERRPRDFTPVTPEAADERSVLSVGIDTGTILEDRP